MKIHVWSDFVCPFCYIGERHLQQAIGDRKDIEIEFMSYQLDPAAPETVEGSVDEVLAKQKGLPLEQVQQMQKHMRGMAANAGLEFVETVAPANTFQAHRVFQYAKEQGKGNEFVEAAQRRYFTEGKSVTTTEDIRAIAALVGLDAEECTRVFTSDQYTDKVREEIGVARQIGVQGVPFFVVDGKYGISGAQPVEFFQEVLAKADHAKTNE